MGRGKQGFLSIGAAFVALSVGVTAAGGGVLKLERANRSGVVSAERVGASLKFVRPPTRGHAPFPSCPALGVISSRGSGETPGSAGWDLGMGPPGLALARAFGSRVQGVEVTYNPPSGYPAVGKVDAIFKLKTYKASVRSGAAQLRAMMKSQRAQCGLRTTLILTGYSQGAELTGDVYLADLSSRPADAALVGGVVLFGDPLFGLSDASTKQTGLQQSVHSKLHHNGALTVHGPWHIGPPHRFPARTHGIVLSYCLIDDIVCQGTGGNPFSGQHSRYQSSGFPADAAAWILSRIGGEAKPDVIYRDKKTGAAGLFGADGFLHRIVDGGTYECLTAYGKLVVNLSGKQFAKLRQAHDVEACSPPMTFDNLAVGTQVTSQYAASHGVIFSSPQGAYIENDGSNPTSPVLGAPGFLGQLTLTLVSSKNPSVSASAPAIAFDVGYIDDSGVEIKWYDAAGRELGQMTADEFGIEYVLLTDPRGRGIRTVTLDTSNDTNGAAIDNLTFY